jgi:hypothetical protein
LEYKIVLVEVVRIIYYFLLKAQKKLSRKLVNGINIEPKMTPNTYPNPITSTTKYMTTVFINNVIISMDKKRGRE